MNQEEFETRVKEIHERVLSKALSPEEENNYTESLFESIRHINKYGQEFWYARDLQVALEYAKWGNFKNVIQKAITACENSQNSVSDHFADIGKMVNIGSGAERELDDYELSRYACYLIVQNGDPRKKVIALGQSYFAVKTRQQELIEQYDNLSEDQKRLAIRREMKEHNKLLVAAAKEAGVETNLEYAVFQNYGYMGLYGGLKAQDIKNRKHLKKSQNILDHMGYEELAANLFRATQTEAKLKRENIQGKSKANQTHYNVGKEVRDTIKRLGGTMPENLPTPEKSIQQIEKEQKRLK
ncbi:DNA damage-inducible protein D [uncultured Subdoligranulum sp.]|uniref:DNA damage-inducible protein D n=1 Tax=uncultured Subdoligranulum sp. TaxID=512298 RepID=UPI00260AD8F7|nr:DNA damage-inducible protein D [uncultured Subdoligranulum sp.]